MLAGLSCLTHHLAPALAKPTLISGLAGAALCLLWGVRAMLGSRSKAWAILTLIPVTFMMLSQTVLTWGGGARDVPGRRMAAVVITVLCVFSIYMLMRVAYAGMTPDGQPASPTKDGEAAPQTPDRPRSKRF